MAGCHQVVQLAIVGRKNFQHKKLAIYVCATVVLYEQYGGGEGTTLGTQVLHVKNLRTDVHK